LNTFFGHYYLWRRDRPVALTNSSQWKESMRRHTLLAALAALGFASPGLVRADDQPVETAVVDAMNKAFGVHPGFRANHAKGVVVEGSFTASPEAAALSRAILFAGSKIPGRNTTAGPEVSALARRSSMIACPTSLLIQRRWSV
jgi:hypothetical protein